MTINRKKLLSHDCQACSRVSAAGMPPWGKNNNAPFFLLVHILMFSRGEEGKGCRKNIYSISAHSQGPKDYPRRKALSHSAVIPSKPGELCLTNGKCWQKKVSSIKVPKSSLDLFEPLKTYFLFGNYQHMYFSWSKYFKLLTNTGYIIQR